MTPDQKVADLLARLGIDKVKAEQIITVSKKKIEAATLVGVAGFWS